MIFITAKFRVKPEFADGWPDISRSFTQACRAEPGCLSYDWYRGLDDATEYVLVEAFQDSDAGTAHVTSDHFKAAQRDLPPHLAETPKIISQNLEDKQGWDELGELAVQP